MPKLTSNSNNANYYINAINKVIAVKLTLPLGKLDKMKKIFMDNGQGLWSLRKGK